LCRCWSRSLAPRCRSGYRRSPATAKGSRSAPDGRDARGARTTICSRAWCKTNRATLLGAQIFFWARLAYAVAYIAGIPWLRTGVWFVSLIGLAIIFLQLL
jgi:hypothetical protein